MSDSIDFSEIESLYELLDSPIGAKDIEESIINELFTVQDVVRFLVSCFASHRVYVGHGTTNYWEEAIEIVQSVMHLKPPCDKSTLKSRLTLLERKLIAKIVVKRIFLRVPTPYLTHRAFFCGHEFYVDRRVIVPRSPIGELIEGRFSPYMPRKVERVLDMCTGSGCIAIATALAFNEDIEVDAVDISDDALEVCRINIEGYDLENCVTPIKSDLFDNLPEGDKYDLIVTNPPYVDFYDLESMPLEYQAEPDLALGSGLDGLDCARRILRDAARYLNDDGILIMEVGNSEENLVEAFPQVPFRFIDLKKGGSGVFLLTKDQLEFHANVFNLDKEDK